MFEFLSDEHARVAWDIFNAGRFDMIDILKAGITAGQLRAVDAIAVQPMLTSVMNTAFREGEPAFMDEVVGFMMHGIASRQL